MQYLATKYQVSSFWEFSSQKFVDYLNQLATTWSGETKVIVEVKDKIEEFQKMGTPPKQLFEKLFGDKV